MGHFMSGFSIQVQAVAAAGGCGTGISPSIRGALKRVQHPENFGQCLINFINR